MLYCNLFLGRQNTVRTGIKYSVAVLFFNTEINNGGEYRMWCDVILTIKYIPYNNAKWFGNYKQYCTVHYCTVLYCTVLRDNTITYAVSDASHYIVLYCTVLYCTVLHCRNFCCAVLKCVVELEKFTLLIFHNSYLSLYLLADFRFSTTFSPSLPPFFSLLLISFLLNTLTISLHSCIYLSPNSLLLPLSVYHWRLLNGSFQCVYEELNMFCFITTLFLFCHY